jgi:hypothetical protein
MQPKFWALATFLIPITGALGYGIWLTVSAAGLAESTRAEQIVRSGALLILTAVFLPMTRPWARAIGIASVCALIVMLAGVLPFEVFRGS